MWGPEFEARSSIFRLECVCVSQYVYVLFVLCCLLI